eukprot:5531082-Amphidinium_carterae.1
MVHVVGVPTFSMTHKRSAHVSSCFTSAHINGAGMSFGSVLGGACAFKMASLKCAAPGLFLSDSPPCSQDKAELMQYHLKPFKNQSEALYNRVRAKCWKTVTQSRRFPLPDMRKAKAKREVREQIKWSSHMM